MEELEEDNTEEVRKQKMRRQTGRIQAYTYVPEDDSKQVKIDKKTATKNCKKTAVRSTINKPTYTSMMTTR